MALCTFTSPEMGIALREGTVRSLRSRCRIAPLTFRFATDAHAKETSMIAFSSVLVLNEAKCEEVGAI